MLGRPDSVFPADFSQERGYPAAANGGVSRWEGVLVSLDPTRKKLHGWNDIFEYTCTREETHMEPESGPDWKTILQPTT